MLAGVERTDAGQPDAPNASPAGARVDGSSGDVQGALPVFSVVDIETSGLSTRRHRILQVAVVRVEHGSAVDAWTSLIKLRWPWQRVGPRRVHGIDRRMLRSAPTSREVLTELAHRIDGTVFVAHNAQFDWSFVERALRAHGIDVPRGDRLCTLYLSRKLDPERRLSHRLGDVCERYGITNERPHDALFDARATAEVLPYVLAAHGVTRPEDLEPLYDRR
jgi:DNA polymerase-3 subunit epsilon